MEIPNQSDHASSHQKTIERLSSLLEVSKALGAEIDLDGLLRVIVGNVTKILGADRSSLFLYDKESDTLWSRVAEGDEFKEIRFPADKGIAGDVTRNCRLVNISDAYRDPRFNPQFDEISGYQTRSVLCAPILNRRGTLIGVIQTLNKKNQQSFDRQDESIIEAMASHIAIALERARLTEALVENERMEEALKLAHQIQMGLLPQDSSPYPEIKQFEISATMEAARQVGGDFYDFFLTDGGQLVVVIGDVSDKGVPAALLMAVTRTYVRAIAGSESSPARVLSRVNSELCREVEQGMFVTLFLGVLDVESGSFRYSNGGHNLPFVFNELGVNELSEAHGMALGVLGEQTYEEDCVGLKPGDAFLLYTDGLSEAMDPDDAEYSVERIRLRLKENSQAAPSEIITMFTGDVAEFVRGAPQSDDITILCLRYLGT